MTMTYAHIPLDSGALEPLSYDQKANQCVDSLDLTRLNWSHISSKSELVVDPWKVHESAEVDLTEALKVKETLDRGTWH
ncbi:hypothetical protein LXL04_038184 [Taraxacum kok-saghyz]